MVAFPKVETDVVVLAERMINGLTEHTADFPNVSKTELVTSLGNYKSSRDAYEDKVSQTKVALAARDDAMQSLLDLMKSDLKQAQVDVGADSPKLTEIGWGPRNQPQPLTPPGDPTGLHPIAEGNGMICLAWNKPASGAGGDVWNYIVERRQQAEGQQFTDWTLVCNVFNCDVKVENQPVDVRLEYRIKAINSAGESMPSNSVSVVLP